MNVEPATPPTITEAFYDELVRRIRRKAPAGERFNPRILLYGGNGRSWYVEHVQTAIRVRRDQNGRALTRAAAERIGNGLRNRLAAS